MSAVYFPLLLSALALLICVISFLYFRSYLKRRTGQERILAEFREEVNRILKSIDETTDRDISLIEEREKNLKSILSETERRIKVFIRELEGQKTAEPSKPALTYGELGKNRYKVREALAEPELEFSSAQSKPQDTPMQAGSDAVPQPSQANQPSKVEQIHSLMRSGLTDAAIASRLGLSIAEVEFATALMVRREN